MTGHRQFEILKYPDRRLESKRGYNREMIGIFTLLADPDQKFYARTGNEF